MAKEATLQVRMDADLKEQAEMLYNRLGTSFAEAVRIFARQSVEENAMPFVIHVPQKSIRGIAAKYANPDLIPLEEKQST
ncbi:MAG: type II toxin-antitoxin system RelB/DinJ family antitoxin [Candidatus Ornithomonoglobus sp.]